MTIAITLTSVRHTCIGPMSCQCVRLFSRTVSVSAEQLKNERAYRRGEERPDCEAYSGLRGLSASELDEIERRLGL